MACTILLKLRSNCILSQPISLSAHHAVIKIAASLPAAGLSSVGTGYFCQGWSREQ